MEIQPQEQKNKLHRYFQSFHSLPKDSSLLTIEQFDKKIMAENYNLFSLFQHVLYLKNQQITSDKSFHTYRRLTTLVYCIMQQYELYLSKIKTLINFWWEGSYSILQTIKCENTFNKSVNKQFSSFKEKAYRDQYFFHLFRCFNSILQKLSQNTYHMQTILIAHPQILSQLESSIQNFKVAVLQNKHQTEYKILMTIQYCRLLTSSFHKRIINLNPMILFNEFCQSINQVIRLMKKFYKPSIIQYRNHLKSILENGQVVFSSSIPYHKLKLFKAIISYLNRFQGETKNPHIQSPLCQGEKRSLIILSRTLNNWKYIYEKKFRKNIKQIDMLIKNKKMEKVGQLQNLRETSKKNEHICKGIDQLKKRRSESLKIKSQINQNQFEIKFMVQRQIQKQFSRIDYLKNRSCSTISNKKFRIIVSSDKKKNIELKLDDYKNRRSEWQNKRKQGKKFRLKLKIR